jgi:uncharacterized protein YuzE
MSTQVTTPSTSALAVTYDLITQAQIAYNKGTEAEEAWEYKVVAEDIAEKIEKEGKFQGFPAVVQYRQSFKVPKANTLDGLISLCGSDEEVTNCGNSGLSVKLGNKRRTKMLETDENGDFVFVPQDEPVDQTADAAVPTNRRLSPDEKLQKQLGEVQLTPEQIQNLIATLQARVAQ